MRAARGWIAPIFVNAYFPFSLKTRPRTTVRNSDVQVCIVWEYNFDTLEQSFLEEYATCWVFLALHHMLYLCILYLYLSLSLYSSSPYDRRHRPLSINIWVFPRIHLAHPPQNVTKLPRARKGPQT